MLQLSVQKNSTSKVVRTRMEHRLREVVHTPLDSYVVCGSQVLFFDCTVWELGLTHGRRSKRRQSQCEAVEVLLQNRHSIKAFLSPWTGCDSGEGCGERNKREKECERRALLSCLRILMQLEQFVPQERGCPFLSFEPLWCK